MKRFKYNWPLILFLANASCGDVANNPFPTGSGGAGSGPPPGNCDPACCNKNEGAPVCSDDGEPSQCFDGKVAPQKPACSNQLAFCQAGQCACNIGEDIRCVSGSAGVLAELCQADINSGSDYESFEVCAADQKCVPGKKSDGAGCLTVQTPCAGDVFTCDSDGNTVLHCQKDAAGFYTWVPTLACRENNFAQGCFAIPNASSPQALCKNACNVLGIPLDGELCDPVGPPVPCAVKVCSPDGKKLVPDHTDCLSPGFECAADEQCKNCNCEGGECAGNNVIASCPAADEAKCDAQ